MFMAGTEEKTKPEAGGMVLDQARRDWIARQLIEDYERLQAELGQLVKLRENAMATVQKAVRGIERAQGAVHQLTRTANALGVDLHAKLSEGKKNGEDLPRPAA